MTQPSSRVFQKAWEKNIPLNVTIELSLKCNLKCSHCYNFNRAEPPPQVKNPLSPFQMHTLLEELHQAGTLIVSFTGGEPLLHPHIFDYISYARKCHLVVRLKSNGTLLTKSLVKRLLQAGANDIEISLYGASPQTHEHITQIPGSFKKTIQGIQNAKALGLLPKISLVLHHYCVEEFPQMIQLCDDLNVDYNLSTEITSRYDGTSSRRKLQLTPSDLWTLYSGPYSYLFKGHVNHRPSVQCGCARVNCGIGSDGTVYPCIGAPIPSGSLHEKSFLDIWN
ncbi:MAG: radical SAM protein, partial [Bdellovibrio sp.]